MYAMQKKTNTAETVSLNEEAREAKQENRGQNSKNRKKSVRGIISDLEDALRGAVAVARRDLRPCDE